MKSNLLALEYMKGYLRSKLPEINSTTGLRKQHDHNAKYINFEAFVLCRNEDHLLSQPRKNIQNVTFKFPPLYFHGIVSMR